MSGKEETEGNGRIDFGTLESRDGLELAHEVVPRMLITEVAGIRAFMGEKGGFFCGGAKICHGQDFRR